MGSVISRAKLIVGALFFLNNTLNTLSKRLKKSPGLPVPNPTLPFWTVPKSPISTGSKVLPQHTDVVIIGSGITGTSVAYNLLKLQPSLRVVILEARDVCSGATGRCVSQDIIVFCYSMIHPRNGGHINPPLFHDYEELKERYGETIAKRMIHFRLAHLTEILAISKDEGILDVSQCREIVHVDVHTTHETYQEAKDLLKVWKADMPNEAADFQADEGPEASQVSPTIPMIAKSTTRPIGYRGYELIKLTIPSMIRNLVYLRELLDVSRAGVARSILIALLHPYFPNSLSAIPKSMTFAIYP